MHWRHNIPNTGESTLDKTYRGSFIPKGNTRGTDTRAGTRKESPFLLEGNAGT